MRFLKLIACEKCFIKAHVAIGCRQVYSERDCAYNELSSEALNMHSEAQQCYID